MGCHPSSEARVACRIPLAGEALKRDGQNRKQPSSWALIERDGETVKAAGRVGKAGGWGVYPGGRELKKNTLDLVLLGTETNSERKKCRRSPGRPWVGFFDDSKGSQGSIHLSDRKKAERSGTCRKGEFSFFGRQIRGLCVSISEQEKWKERAGGREGGVVQIRPLGSKGKWGVGG